MRQPTQQGIALIKAFEGFSAQPYLCPAGIPTIGFGHMIGQGEAFPSQGISWEEATALLKQDAAIAARAVLRLIQVSLSDGQFDALVSFTFNLGAGALQRSTLRRKVNRQEHEEAAGEFRRWIWAGGQKSRGLMRRREAERALYLQ
jgi:lysozyme